MRKSARFYLILVLIATVLLLLAGATQKSFWEDESATATRVSSDDPGSLLSGPWENHVLVRLSMTLWGEIFGYDELGLRSLSIVFAVFTLLLTFNLTSDLLDEKAALAAVALLGFSPLFIMFAHNARYYSMAAALALLVTYFMYRYQVSNNLAYLLLYMVTSAAFFLVTYTSVAVIVACNIWWLARWILQKERKFSKLILWISAHAATMLLLIPGYERVAQDVGTNYGFSLSSNLVFEIVKRLAYLGFTFSVGQAYSPLSPLAWMGVGMVVVIGVFALISNRQVVNFRLPVLFVLVIALSNVMISLISTWLSQIWQNLPHWALYGLPFLAMWLGAGFAKMKPRAVLLSSVVIAVAYGVGLFNYFSNRQFIQPIYAVPWRSIFDMIQTEAHPDVLVICDGDDYACGYYSTRYGYGKNNLGSWNTSSKIPEVWLIQTNLSRVSPWTDRETVILEELSASYQATEIYNYAQQDESIRWLKTKLMGQEDFEYRVNVFRFFNP